MILVVEDEPAIAGTIKATLELHGFSVATAGSCNEALAVIDENPPTLVLSDIKLPDHSGFDLLRIVKANKATADIPVVFVSALDRAQDVENGLRAGAAAYLAKPFELSKLVSVVCRLAPDKSPLGCQLILEIDHLTERSEALRAESQKLIYQARRVSGGSQIELFPVESSETAGKASGI